MIKLLLPLFLLTFIGTMAFAQGADTFSISGRAISRYSGRPIRGGSILVNKNIGTTCDTAGRFSVRGLHRGRYKLSFRSIGYKRKDTVIMVEGKNITDLILSVSVDSKRFNSKKAGLDIR